MKLEVPLSPLISLLVFIKRQYPPLFLVLTGLSFELNKRHTHTKKKKMHAQILHVKHTPLL